MIGKLFWLFIGGLLLLFGRTLWDEYRNPSEMWE